jgi:hypothetical protein
VVVGGAAAFANDLSIVHLNVIAGQEEIVEVEVRFLLLVERMPHRPRQIRVRDPRLDSPLPML